MTMKEDIILKIENLSKQYRLGKVGTGTLGHDINRAWAKLRGKEDPYLKIGAVNDRSSTASSDYVWALKDINFEVKRGEIIGIIGKNGAGKSTLLKILSRVTSPTTGSIKVGGRMASLLEVGTGMHPELTGRENIYLNGAILGMTKAEIAGKIDAIIDFSGCQMYIDTPVKRYSSGMGVRLGFAVAAFLEPDILVVDEVLAVGDAEFQKKAIGKMQDISSTGGRTVLFVSHNMASIQNLCKRIILLDNGSVAIDTIDVEKGINYYLRDERRQIDTSIKNRKDRAGLGNIIFTHAEILNDKGEQINTVISGADIIIKFTCNVVSEVRGNLSVAFTITRSNSEVLSFFSNDFTNDTLRISGAYSSFTVKCRIPNFPMTEGLYDSNISLKIDGTMEDWVKKAFTIKVINGDFYNTGKINPSSHGGVLINHQWMQE